MSPRERLYSAPALFLWAALVLVAGVLLAFLVAPIDASSMGFSQKIFYFHAPIAETALVAFGVSFVSAIVSLRRGAEHASGVGEQLEVAAVRLGLVFSGLVLVTGMIWGRAAWGVWWAWEPRLTTFLLAVLVYAAYFVVRAAVDDEGRRAVVGSVYAIVAFVTVPITFFATRYLPEGLHPVVITSSGARMEGSMVLAFVVCTAGMLLLLAALLRTEVTIARAQAHVSRVKEEIERRQAAGPAPDRAGVATPGGAAERGEPMEGTGRSTR